VAATQRSHSFRPLSLREHDPASAKTYRYPRYNFTNHSDDIRAVFCEYCDKVGVEWRRMNRWSISVARRDSVALMDRRIGPKR